MKKNNLILGKILLSGLVSLFWAASCFVVGSAVPESFSEALRGGSMGSQSIVGPVGGAMAGVAAWAVGPWLRWLFLLVPWAWWPTRWGRATRGGKSRRRWLWLASALILVLALLGHPVLRRAGFPPLAGGAMGAWAYGILDSLLGGLGAFLLTAGLLAFLLIRVLPPLRFDSPLLDALQRQWSELSAPAGVLLVLPFRGARWLARSLGVLWRSWRERRAEAELRAQEERERDQLEEFAPFIAGEESLEEVEKKGFSPPEHGGEGYAGLDSGGHAGLDEKWVSSPPLQEGGGHRPGPTLLGGRKEENEDEEFALSRDPGELLKSENLVKKKRRKRRGEFPPPSLDLLDDVVKENRGFSRESLQMNARLLLETLKSFGIQGKINQIRPGPVVTTFEFEPDRGVKVSQITSRADDLALAMRAIRIRIVAPIPGKAAVGIEVPNSYPQMVGLKEVLTPLFNEEDIHPLTVGLGKDPEGVPVSADLAEMPHLLVAGATGSGKSVCLNSLICSLLLRNGPDQLRFLMIDPKMLELSVYNGIPHLLHPVITDAKEALKALKIMVAEMTVRYNKLAKHGVRNIIGYNMKVRAGQIKDIEGRRVEETLPYIVVIVDELADLMMLLGAELETPVARLAQMARAVGIHLILATQRPSVNVITGVIKANFPSRIGFRVISKVDSRTILDVMGAESLLGKGDSLFLMAGMTQPRRIHGAYISIEECERIAQHWFPLAEGESRLDIDAVSQGRSALDLGEDDLLQDAKRIVVFAQSGSTSMLQRKLRVGYTRAARLMDMLEEIGVVGPFEGSKAREVLIKPDELEAEG